MPTNASYAENSISSSPARVSIDDCVATIVLNAPETGNAFSAAMVSALAQALDEGIAARPKLLVFRTSGRDFSLGFDLRTIDHETEGDLLMRFVRIEHLLQRIYESPARTVAIVKGRSFGIGGDLLAACDLRICHEDAVIAFPGPQFGLALGSSRLAERVGATEAMTLLTQFGVLSSADAFRIGLATAIVGSDEEADAQVVSVAADLSLDWETSCILRRLCTRRNFDADMAAMVRSLCRPGLRERLKTYVLSGRSKLRRQAGPR